MVCSTCYKETENESPIDEDGSHTCCRWCGLEGDLVCCSSCPRAYCSECVVRNNGSDFLTELEESEEVLRSWFPSHCCCSMGCRIIQLLLLSRQHGACNMDQCTPLGLRVDLPLPAALLTSLCHRTGSATIAMAIYWMKDEGTARLCLNGQKILQR